MHDKQLKDLFEDLKPIFSGATLSNIKIERNTKVGNTDQLSLFFEKYSLILKLDFYGHSTSTAFVEFFCQISTLAQWEQSNSQFLVDSTGDFSFDKEDFIPNRKSEIVQDVLIDAEELEGIGPLRQEEIEELRIIQSFQQIPVKELTLDIRQEPLETAEERKIYTICLQARNNSTLYFSFEFYAYCGVPDGESGLKISTSFIYDD